MSALDAVGNLNKELKEQKEAWLVKTKVIEILSTPTRRPKSLNLSSIIGKIVNGDWDETEIAMKLCSLCAKCFPKVDVVIGSCGC